LRLRNGCCIDASVEKKRINTEDTEARAQRAREPQRRRKRFNTEGSERGEYRGHGEKKGHPGVGTPSLSEAETSERRRQVR